MATKRLVGFVPLTKLRYPHDGIVLMRKRQYTNWSQLLWSVNKSFAYYSNRYPWSSNKLDLLTSLLGGFSNITTQLTPQGRQRITKQHFFTFYYSQFTLRSSLYRQSHNRQVWYSQNSLQINDKSISKASLGCNFWEDNTPVHHDCNLWEERPLMYDDPDRLNKLDHDQNWINLYSFLTSLLNEKD